ncbi:MAG: hypothetical protein ABT00_05860 [Bordetella sp. SCN 68-11]|nr:MAG: hypothetical protein ABT00_05860 [Bordetella sp. SCN 68-11]
MHFKRSFMILAAGLAGAAAIVAHDVLKYYQGAATGSVDRIRIFKLAWDLCGDAFASRQMQYERYYVGDPVRLLASSYHEGNRSACTALVDRAMELAGEPAGTPDQNKRGQTCISRDLS